MLADLELQGHLPRGWKATCFIFPLKVVLSWGYLARQERGGASFLSPLLPSAGPSAFWLDGPE